MNDRHLGEVPGWRLFGRGVRPFHAALCLSTGCLAALEYVNATPLGKTEVGDLLGLVALAASVLLALGWWGRSDRAAEWGLTLAAGSWAARGVLVLLTETTTFGTVWLTAILSWAWAIGAAGAWVLEMADHEWPARTFGRGGRE